MTKNSGLNDSENCLRRLEDGRFLKEWSSVRMEGCTAACGRLDFHPVPKASVYTALPEMRLTAPTAFTWLQVTETTSFGVCAREYAGLRGSDFLIEFARNVACWK